MDEAGLDELILVGHSLAGSTMPGVVGRLGDRVRHVVFVACTVPPDGASSFSTLDADVRDLAGERVGDAGGPDGELEAWPDDLEPDTLVMDADLTGLVFGKDLTPEQLRWCAERSVPEAPGPAFEPVDLTPLRRPVPRTWVRTVRDLIVPPSRQLRFAETVGDCPIVDLDSGHMPMVARPRDLATILDSIAAA